MPPINEYQRKRDFTKTPEPSGQAAAHSDGLPRFVIQKHQATRAHYDLRLEANGVLKSWAIPKGPSLNPHDKRLAKMVEDHPLDYQYFEGVIPTGNYGAGPVIIWDRGTYELHGDFAQKMAKGHLSFTLHGTKLKGEFSLVRLPNDENNWLLIKKDDEFASDTADVTLQAESVVSHKKIEELSDNLDLSGATPEAMPAFIKPMQAETAPTAFDNPHWLFEIKWDGCRVIVVKDAHQITLYSRQGNKFTQFETGVFETINHDCILDGEIVVLDENGVAHFQLLQKYVETKKGRLAYYFFDILHLDGYNLRNLPLVRRKKILQSILPSNAPLLHYNAHVYETGAIFFNKAAPAGAEGIMAKKIDSAYFPAKHVSSWLKIKNLNREEAVIAGYTLPRGGRSHFGALILGRYKNGELTYIGHTGTGFDDHALQTLFHTFQPLIQERSPFKTIPPTNETPVWVRPELVAEIQFQEWTEDGVMRQPVFLGLREDKKVAYFPHHEDKEKVTIGNRELTLTHLDKIFWPNEGFTKKDLITYYQNVTEYILPFLRDRPESLRRQPHGIDDPGFWHKDVRTIPDWIQRVPIFSESHQTEIQYIVCQNEATLVYMVNLGCIEMHPWFSRLGQLDKPDFLVLDLDPLEIAYDYVVDCALVIKEILDRAEVPSYPKTSGARGLHVMVPLGAEYSYEQALLFAKIIANLAHEKTAEFTSLERNPVDRPHKVYIDYLQNGKGKTIAAPYSVRARPGAPVSTPLLWKEVVPGLNPRGFTIINIVPRLKKIGDIFQPVLEQKIDLAKILKKLQGFMAA